MSDKSGDHSCNRERPQLDERGLLPPGVHDVSMEDVEAMFGQMQRTTRRMVLFKSLKQFVDEVRRAGFATEIRIDGSFVMKQVDEPGDIDVVLVMKPDWDMASADIKPFEYNLLSKKRTKQTYGIEVYTVLAGIADDPDGMSAFFEQVNPRWSQLYNWPSGLKKGVLRVAV